MKTFPKLLLVAAILNVVSVQAQPMGGAPRGPHFGGAMDKLFGENQSFSATMEMQTETSPGKTMTMPGKIYLDAGNSRFEMDMTKISGDDAHPEAAAQMKQMGMDSMITIGLPAQKISYLVYPGMHAYVENPMPEMETNVSPDNYKATVIELGKDTVDGHPCVKNKVVVTDKDGVAHESTVWNATDLKNFPVKIQMNENGHDLTMTFKNVSLAKPDASLFQPPSDYKKYDNMMQMMRAEMMKRMGGGMMGMPPQQ